MHRKNIIETNKIVHITTPLGYAKQQTLPSESVLPEGEELEAVPVSCSTQALSVGLIDCWISKLCGKTSMTPLQMIF